MTALPKVGPLDAKRLAKLGISTVEDLLLTLPFGWDEYGEPVPIAYIEDGKQATVIGIISAIAAKRTLRKRMQLTQATLLDDAGDALRLVWFNQPYIATQLRKGDRVAVAGMVKGQGGGFGGTFEMRNPLHEKVGDARSARIGGLMPKYHLVAGLSSKRIATWVEAALPLASGLEDTLPADVRARHRLLPVADAVRLGHRPETEEEWRHARRRMVFAELFELQAAFALMRAGLAAEPAVAIPYRQDVIDTFKTGLGFELTRAQRRSIWEAFQDMQRPVPMNRLLNGDVGSGKKIGRASCRERV